MLAYFGLASGFLSGEYRDEADLTGAPRAYRIRDTLNPRGLRILKALDAVSARLGVKNSQIALAWLRAQGCIPIASATRREQLEELARSVEVNLDGAALATLDAASVIGPGEQPVRTPPPRPTTTHPRQLKSAHRRARRGSAAGPLSSSQPARISRALPPPARPPRTGTRRTSRWPHPVPGTFGFLD